MIVYAPWYVPNTVIRRDLNIPTVKEKIRHYSSQYSASLRRKPKGPISEPRGATKQVIPKTPAKLSAYQILSVIVVFVILLLQVQFVRPIPISTRGLEGNSYRGALLSTLLHATVYVFYSIC
jgi:hypothetical protein